MYSYGPWVDTHKAAELINDCGYYCAVEPTDLAGSEMYGMFTDDNELAACVLILRSGAQAYLDYLVVRQDLRGKDLARTLLDHTYNTLQRHKVRVVHTCVSGENAASSKLLMRFGAKIGFPYISGTIRLEEEHGR